MAKQIYTRIPQPNKAVVDLETGEILSSVTNVKVENIDEFIMVFLNCFNPVFKLEGLELKIMMCCWKKSNIYSSSQPSNQIINNAQFKDYVRECGLDLSNSTIDAYISKLAKKGIISKVCRGCYQLNPDYFFKGKLSDRSKLKLTIEN